MPAAARRIRTVQSQDHRRCRDWNGIDCRRHELAGAGAGQSSGTSGRGRIHRCPDGDGKQYEDNQKYQKDQFGAVVLPLYAILDARERK